MITTNSAMAATSACPPVGEIPASLVIGTRDMVYRGLIALFFQCPLGFAVFSLITEGSLCRKGPHGGYAAYHEGCYFSLFVQTAISFAIFYGLVSLIGYPLWKEVRKTKND